MRIAFLEFGWERSSRELRLLINTKDACANLW